MAANKATYPTDIIFDVNNFSVVSTVTYNNTGASNVTFSLGGAVDHIGQVLAWNDGSLSQTNEYFLTTNSAAVTFYAAPNASNLTFKIIQVPDNLQKYREISSISSIHYSNSTPVTVDSNTYVVNDVRTVWALPDGVSAIDKDDILVTVNGLLLETQQYVYPSTTLDTRGIDISPALANSSNLELRVLTSTSLNDRCRDLSDIKPDSGFKVTPDFLYLSFESQAGYEKRRSVSRKKKRTWELQYTNKSGTVKNAMETFFDARLGGFESFYFDLTHVNEESGTAITRFEKLDISHNLSRGTQLDDNFYNINVTLKEVDD